MGQGTPAERGPLSPDTVPRNLGELFLFHPLSVLLWEAPSRSVSPKYSRKPVECFQTSHHTWTSQKAVTSGKERFCPHLATGRPEAQRGAVLCSGCWPRLGLSCRVLRLVALPVTVQNPSLPFIHLQTLFHSVSHKCSARHLRHEQETPHPRQWCVERSPTSFLKEMGGRTL